MLTLITVTKDDAAGLRRTLASSLRLRADAGARHLVIDSSAPDAAREVRQAVEAAPGAAYHWQPPRGISPAFNYGLSLAPDGWIWFLNGGDEVHPGLDSGWLLRLLEQTRAEVLIGEIQYLSGKCTRHPPLPALWPPVHNWIPHPATLVRKSALVPLGGFAEQYRIAMDGELWFRLFKSGVVTDLVSVPLALFHPGGLSYDTARTYAEIRDVHRRHRVMLFKDWLKQGLGILRAMRWYARAAGKGGRPAAGGEGA